MIRLRHRDDFTCTYAINGIWGNQPIYWEADYAYERPLHCQLFTRCETCILEASSALQFGEPFTSIVHVSLLLPPISLSRILRVASNRGMLLPVDRDRPFRATVDLSGSYHLFVNWDPDVGHASLDREINHDHKSIYALVVTIDLCGQYCFS